MELIRAKPRDSTFFSPSRQDPSGPGQALPIYSPESSCFLVFFFLRVIPPLTRRRIRHAIVTVPSGIDLTFPLT